MELQHTPLLHEHQSLGAKMIDFGGWLMPVQYTSIAREHAATRTAAGLFDVSHMGEITVTGTDALAYLNNTVTNDVSKLTPGRVQYALLLNEQGGTIDDLLIYCHSEQHYLLVVNASNTDKDFAWLQQQQRQAPYSDLSVVNDSPQYAQLALQGPQAQAILQKLTAFDLATLPYFHFATMTVADDEMLVSRTGYTGEDGFELYCLPSQASHLWRALLQQGESLGIEPIGLGARDTLRLEAALPLYGHELAADISPLEAGLGFACKLAKERFIGQTPLQQQKEQGLTRRLVGLEITGRGIAREGYRCQHAGRDIGFVASGTQTPTLQKAIATAFVEPEYSQLGTQIDVVIRDNPVSATVIPLPFYKRA